MSNEIIKNFIYDYNTKQYKITLMDDSIIEIALDDLIDQYTKMKEEREKTKPCTNDMIIKNWSMDKHGNQNFKLANDDTITINSSDLVDLYINCKEDQEAK